MGRKGRWVFQPLPKWERLPASFYSFRRSEIYLTCFLRNVPPELTALCLKRDVLPPPKLRGAKLRAWIRVECGAASRADGEASGKTQPTRADGRSRA